MTGCAHIAMQGVNCRLVTNFMTTGNTETGVYNFTSATDFTIDESVGVQFGRGNRESPVIIGRDRKKIQTPKTITYNYV